MDLNSYINRYIQIVNERHTLGFLYSSPMVDLAWDWCFANLALNYYWSFFLFIDCSTSLKFPGHLKLRKIAIFNGTINEQKKTHWQRLKFKWEWQTEDRTKNTYQNQINTRIQNYSMNAKLTSFMIISSHISGSMK